ncbi:MAG: S41 family peptidase [Bacteroides sp.]|nr:S41 family peptidase [Bacteroides sp.]MCM1096245.1 S41 family peptidase [Terasakiella sp.]
MKKSSRIYIWLPLMLAAAIVAGLWAGFLLAGGDKATPGQAKLQKIYEIVGDEYVEAIEVDSLIEMTIPEMLRNLDPHSVYIARSDLDRVNRDLESSFYGVGIQFQLMADTICVVEIVAGGPAERVGMQAGDRIVAVDGRPMTGRSITNEDVLSTLRGEKGSKVELTVRRTGAARPLKFEIERGEIPSRSVNAQYLLDGDIGYVRLGKFAQNTYAEFLQALNSLRAKGARSYVLDLRGNTGGMLDQAILIANEFLEPYRAIVQTKGRHEVENTNWLADGTGIFADAPLTVLIDEFSASSSEIVAGAVQDNDRGLIIGRRSFGKGLVQRQISLPDSSQLRLTVQRYYTPAGRCIQKDYTRGNNDSYDSEIFDRYANGEIFSADSVKFDADKVFSTVGGRKVYGGGGIMPDVFVPSDTTGYSSYYIAVSNAGLLQKFAYEYADLNRAQLSQARDVEGLLRLLPGRDVLLSSFIHYAVSNGIPARWYYINISAGLIVNQLKALIAGDILGMNAYYEIINDTDPVVREAVRQIRSGAAAQVVPQQPEEDPRHE